MRVKQDWLDGLHFGGARAGVLVWTEQLTAATLGDVRAVDEGVSKLTQRQIAELLWGTGCVAEEWYRTVGCMAASIAVLRGTTRC